LFNLKLETPPQPPPPPPVESATHKEEREKKEQQVKAARKHLSEAFEILTLLEGLPPEEVPDHLGREIDVFTRRMGAHDALLSFDIRVSSSKGEVFHISAHSQLPDFTVQGMLTQAPATFETSLYTTIFRPLKNRIQDYINTFVQNDNLVSGKPVFLEDRFTENPTIPEAGLPTFLASPPPV